MELFSFEKLEAFKSARLLAIKVYRLLASFPQHERFALCQQLQRAAISIPSNIAEGSGRCSMKEKIHFIEIAYGSLLETYCQLTLAKDLGYISDDNIKEIKPIFFEVSRLLSGLKNSFSSKINP